MLKKDNDVKWSLEDRYLFDQIKKDLGEAPMLISAYYSEFLIFSFSYDNTDVAVILQRNEYN
jgi:hypothetical protein